MCQCLLSSSIDSPCTTGSYKHAYIRQPFGFTSWLHSAPEGLRRKPRMLGEGKGCVFLDPSGAPRLALIMGAHLGALKRWSWGVGGCLRNWTLRRWRAGFEFWLFRTQTLDSGSTSPNTGLPGSSLCSICLNIYKLANQTEKKTCHIMFRNPPTLTNRPL